MKNETAVKKTELRKIFKEKRALLSAQEKEDMSLGIASTFLSHFDVQKKNIHVFLPILRLNEPDIFKLVNQLFSDTYRKKSTRIFTAIVRPGNLKLTHVEIGPQTVYTPDDWGIPVPSGEPLDPGFKFDMVLVPMLCCDKKGNRVGYGKGYYDHFLAQQPEAARIGISFFEPVDKIKDIEKHDIPIETLVTPDRVYTFGKREK